MNSFMCCFGERKTICRPRYEKSAILASETAFTVNEVEALYDMFKKLSSSIFDDGSIHKEEFLLALCGNRNNQNLFANRMFQLFDSNHDGVIEFSEFVLALSVFHPDAPQSEKVAFAFQIYDIRQTGFIEHGEVKEMIWALLDESDSILPDDTVEAIIYKTFEAADSKRDGKIDLEEWKEFVAHNPSLIKNMTVPYLKDFTRALPSFVLRSDTEVDTNNSIC
ncbi:hypothetical protein SLA2020_496260 [Shorea laevis]